VIGPALLVRSTPLPLFQHAGPFVRQLKRVFTLRQVR
jgi:hypothetical protein